MKGLYLFVDFLVIVIPLVCSFHSLIRFDRFFKAFMISNILVAIPFIVWDILFTKMGAWSFNPNYTCGIYFFNLPLEEVLFFTCIPFSCVFTFFCLEKLNVRLAGKKWFFAAVPIASIAIAVGALLHLYKSYTATSFLLAAIAVLSIGFAREKWITTFLISYLVLLIPFLIVNGLLTGTGLASPVVIYNPSAILGWRFITIPVEDFFYSFVMQYFNVAVFQFVRNRLKQRSDGAKEGLLL